MTRLKISLICLVLSVMACTESVNTQTPVPTGTAVIRTQPMKPDIANLTAVECDPCE